MKRITGMTRVRRQKKKIREMTPQELASAPDDIVIAYNFMRIRRNLNLTQQKTADLGETTVGYVGKIETAAVGFGTRAQKKWSRIFKVDRTEFLKRPGVGIKVTGIIIDKGVVAEYAPGHEMEYMPSLPGHEADGDSLLCLKVGTDTLYPHLRKDSCLYVLTVPVSAIHNDNLVICAEDGADSVKEVEWLSDGKILFKGLGRGSTVTKGVSELATVQKVAFISMEEY
jgi:transcriptional regulator with XRE-family HTH domain